MVIAFLFNFFISLKPTPDPGIYQDLITKGTADILCTLYSPVENIAEQASHLELKEQKGAYVFQTLYTDAVKTQKRIKNFLEKKNIKYQSFYIVNAIQIPKADKTVIDYLMQLPEVVKIEYNSSFKVHRPVEESLDLHVLERRSPDMAIQWGITRIKADTLWSLGIKGKGVVLGGEDTGVELHSLIKGSYRGTGNTNGYDHNYNWHDAVHSLHPLNRDTSANEFNNPCGLDTLAPCDDDNHGTHTVGTMAATDFQIGVAPEAKWIACRCMERGWGTLAQYLECFQWFLAPTDISNKNPNPSKAPHVINNSWGCPTEEGCNASNFNTMQQVISNLKAAGIVVVASAGNSGARGCSSINDPPAMFEPSFSVGATNSGDSIAGFSSRGPVTVDGSNRIKPNISAPGVGVLSTIRNNNLALLSGTSMAGPHVAGAVALLISAFPQLAGKVELIEDILEKSADLKTARILCGSEKNDAIPNNTYGFGRLNVYKAYVLAKSLLSTGITTTTRLYDVKVYPNPATNQVYFDTKQNDLIKQVLITDSNGGVLINKNKIGSNNYNLTLNIPAGLYFYQVTSTYNKYSGKLVIVHGR